ncbi:MAG: HD domain-containing protein [Methanomassiliicoccaceae archaeon]|nr:HD domain-containing protein [Methanomassiliicoccaceae archaeon]HQA20598.1 HD domain-containing protein [Methanomassiliicoccaceae archaeon]HQD87088.1 HD domain-containing protein [Methanomassiliicoccaceae archaeon]
MDLFEIRDPLYGFVEVNEWERTIIDHPAFQRLRHIKQLGLTEYIYPSATHSRFEHSIGTMSLASQMYDCIVGKEKNIQILKDNLSFNESGIERDRQLIRLAALVHDIGHSPFSHAPEDLMPINPQTGKPYRHEDYTVAVIKGPLKAVIEEHPINGNYHIQADEVAAVIEGNAAVLKDRVFWKVLISGQLDADRGDYLLRDSHHIGVKYGVYDYSRMVKSLVLGTDPESGEVILGISHGSRQVAEAVILARYQMFTQVYFHKTRRAYDFHLNGAMREVLPNGLLPPPDKIEEYISYDDSKIWTMIKQASEKPDCKAVVNWSHIRLLHNTSETPDEKEMDYFEGLVKALDKKEIWNHVDLAETTWYRLNDQESKEISIIDKWGKVDPLSSFSKIVKNMGAVKRSSVYVKMADREMAEQIKKGM